MIVYHVVVTIAEEEQTRVKEYSVAATKLHNVVDWAIAQAETTPISITIEPEHEQIIKDRVKSSKLL